MKKYCLLIMLILLTSLFGCYYRVPFDKGGTISHRGQGFEYEKGAFGFRDGGMYLGVTSNENIFDIDNVSFNVYIAISEEYAETRFFSEKNIEKYDLYFAIYAAETEKNSNDHIRTVDDYLNIDKYYLIESIDESIMINDEQYQCVISGSSGAVTYNKYHVMTIPKEVFTQEEGYFKLDFTAFYKTTDDLIQNEVYKYYSNRAIILQYKLTSDNKVEINFDDFYN